MTSLQAIGRSIGLDVRMTDGQLHVKRIMPRPMWCWRLSAKSSFCRAAVATGLLSQRQMVHAALRYRLGCSKDDAVIYWQIDLQGVVHDGKLMWYGPDCHRLKNRNATWIWFLLKKHFGIPQEAFQSQHVFFGSHLLAQSTDTVCVVEAEKSAVILSEWYPAFVWLAAGGMSELQPEKFLPLRAYRVVLFPDTDPEGRAYTAWYQAAQRVMRYFLWPRGNRIYVSDFLERHATADQKCRKIDLVDFLMEASPIFNLQSSIRF